MTGWIEHQEFPGWKFQRQSFDYGERMGYAIWNSEKRYTVRADSEEQAIAALKKAAGFQ